MQERQRIGETLRAARLAKGVSLEEAAAATRIRRSALQALESDEFDALPASVYTRGFLINYARYLGLIAEDLAEEFDRQQRERAEPSLSAAQSAAEKEPERRFSLFSSKFLWVFVLILALGVILNFLYQEFLSAGPPPAPTEVAEAPTGAPTPLAETTPLPTATPVPTPSPLPPPTPTPITGVNISLRATTQQVWLGVTVDGAGVFAGTIGPETDQGTEPLSWSAEESISILFGRTGGVELTLNEREIESLIVSKDPVTFEAVKTDAGEIAITVSINGTPVPTSQ